MTLERSEEMSSREERPKQALLSSSRSSWASVIMIAGAFGMLFIYSYEGTLQVWYHWARVVFFLIIGINWLIQARRIRDSWQRG